MHLSSVKTALNNLLKTKTKRQENVATITDKIKAVEINARSFLTSCFICRRDEILEITRGSPLDTIVTKTIKTDTET